MVRYDPARAKSVEALDLILNQEQFSNEVLNAIFLDSSFEILDKRFISALVYGTLERLPLIDYIIAESSDVALPKIDPIILLILRITVWQIKFADKIPAYAAINEAVSLSKHFKKRQFSAYTNAVLRAIEKNDIKLSKKREHLNYGVSSEIYGLYKKWFGEQRANSILQSYFSLKSGLSVLFLGHQVEKNKWIEDCKNAGIEIREGQLHQDAYYLSAYQNIHQIPGFKEGLVYIQDESSMLTAKALHFIEKDIEQVKILDACAGLGGKSIAFTNELDNVQITALEPNENRFRGMEENICRLGFKHIKAIHSDLQTYRQRNPEERFDFILLDVPCSGLGVLKHKPDIKLKLSYKKIQEFPVLQMELLQEASQLLNDKGILCYSTCTINPEENQHLIEKFLSTKSGYNFSKLDMKELKPLFKNQEEALLSEIFQESDISILPNMSDLDGFYITCLQKE